MTLPHCSLSQLMKALPHYSGLPSARREHKVVGLDTLPSGEELSIILAPHVYKMQQKKKPQSEVQ